MVLAADFLANHGTTVNIQGGYCSPSRFDEMVDNNGNVRPTWLKLLEILDERGPKYLERVRGESRRLFRESGVTHNFFSHNREPSQPWEVDPLPMLISSAEWSVLEAGLAQRMRLQGLLLADILGPQRTVAGGILPPELIFSHPAWHPALHGLPLPQPNPLTLAATDLVRDDQGRFRVLLDRLQVPSGAGYALENRLIQTRTFPQPFRSLNIQRLPPFFRALRANLENLAVGNRGDPHLVLLASGLDHATHMEQVFLSNYLGLTLAQAADLVVRAGRVSIRTLDGLHPVDVILRRIEDIRMDPLELGVASESGVVGLLHAIRRGGVVFANATGTALLEHRGLHAYLPAICRYLLGEDLLLHGLPTWWCGDAAHMGYVRDHWDSLMIQSVLPPPGQPPWLPREMDHAARQALLEQVGRTPHGYVAMEFLSPATTPVFIENTLEPQVLSFRFFATSDRERVDVMPGGHVRFLPREVGGVDLRAINKGVWVISDAPGEAPTRERVLRPIEATLFTGELPSRVAENLFWIGRYAERAENAIRLVRVILLLILEETGLTGEQRRLCLRTLLRAFTHVTGNYPGFTGEDAEALLDAPEQELMSALLDEERPGSMGYALQSFIQAVQNVRERFSLSTWQVIQTFPKGLERLNRRSSQGLSEVLREVDSFILSLMAFAGQTMESMTRGQGWWFINSGRRLERAIFISRLMEWTLAREAGASHESIVTEFLLAISDSLITFRRRYRSRLDAGAALELLLLDETNPRSLAFQIVGLDKHAAHLPRGRKGDSHYRSPEGRITLEALALLRLADAEQLAVFDGDSASRPNLLNLLNQMNNLLPLFSMTLSGNYFQHTRPLHQLAPIL